MEDKSDTSCGLGNSSVCHNCFGTTTEMQFKISLGVLQWDKLKASTEWGERKLSPTSSQRTTKQKVDDNKKTKKSKTKEESNNKKDRSK